MGYMHNMFGLTEVHGLHFGWFNHLIFWILAAVLIIWVVNRLREKESIKEEIKVKKSCGEISRKNIKEQIERIDKESPTRESDKF